ncbi:MAG: hypothetical protein V3T01_13900 [Myxococcota bacterium]
MWKRFTLQSTRLSLVGFLVASVASVASGSTFSQLSAGEITPVPAPGVDDLLTEAGLPDCSPPIVAFTLAQLGLVLGDEIDALSFGDDLPIQGRHILTFSVDEFAVGDAPTGVFEEVTVGTAGTCPAPTGTPKPPEASGDVFEQIPYSRNQVALPPNGYRDGPTGFGDERDAAWNAPSPQLGPLRDDLDGFDYSNDAAPRGIYFSLAPGSPSLGILGVTVGDILFVRPGAGAPLLGPFIASLFGVGPATDVILGIAGEDLDALNIMAFEDPTFGVIRPGILGPSNWSGSGPGCCVVSSHLVQFSVAPGGAFLEGDVLTRDIISPPFPAPGIAGVHTLGIEGLGLDESGGDDLNALEAYTGKINVERVFTFYSRPMSAGAFLAISAGSEFPVLIATGGLAPLVVSTRQSVANINGSAGLPLPPPTPPTTPTTTTTRHLTTFTAVAGDVPGTGSMLPTTSTSFLTGGIRSATATVTIYPGYARAFSTATGLSDAKMAVRGNFKMCVLTASCGSILSVPLTVNGTVGVGLGGSFQGFAKSVGFSVVGAPWTSGIASITGISTQNGGTLVSRSGYAHGPASLTSSTVTTSGRIQLVTPAQILTDLGGFAVIVEARWHFLQVVPEPGSFLLLSSGVVGLLVLGRRRMKS